jgi:8-oxo-dGTP pyrophosphatase MutT (NUDIX family)
MEKQLTATAYIVNNQEVLLIYHKKMQKWLPPGGHVDPNELPSDAAIREAFEETGIEIEIITQENVWVKNWNAKSFPRPYLCLLEEIPAYRDQPAHQHMDFIYVAKSIGGKLENNHIETDGLKWFNLQEIEKLESDVDIFEETKQVIRQIILGIIL